MALFNQPKSKDLFSTQRLNPFSPTLSLLPTYDKLWCDTWVYPPVDGDDSPERTGPKKGSIR